MRSTKRPIWTGISGRCLAWRTRYLRVMHAHFDAFAAKPVAEGDDYGRFWKAQAILPQTDFQQM